MSNAISDDPFRAVPRHAAASLAGVLLGGLCLSSMAAPDAAKRGGAITIETRVELILEVGGTTGTTVLVPAVHVVAGNLLSYTLQVKNNGPTAVENYSFTSPIPAHMVYLADSAVAPGAVVTFSVDGGTRFDEPDNLRVATAPGAWRGATPADYTHIRWTLRNRLNAGSTALARFRARVLG